MPFLALVASQLPQKFHISSTIYNQKRKREHKKKRACIKHNITQKEGNNKID